MRGNLRWRHERLEFWLPSFRASLCITLFILHLPIVLIEKETDGEGNFRPPPPHFPSLVLCPISISHDSSSSSVNLQFIWEVLRDEIAGREAGSLTTCSTSGWSNFRHRTQTSTSIMACYLSLEPIQNTAFKHPWWRSSLIASIETPAGSIWFFAAPASQTGEMEWFIGGVAGESDCRFGFFKQRLYPSQIQLPPNNTSINPALVFFMAQAGWSEIFVMAQLNSEESLSEGMDVHVHVRIGLTQVFLHPKPRQPDQVFISCYCIGA